MDCRQIASQLCRLSADDLPSATAVAMWEHLTRCPECEQEWKTFQATLHVLSSAPQPLISAEQSAQIWQNCSEKLHQRIEERRLAAQRPAFFNWARSQPRWGWAALGSAVAVLGGVWWLTPQDAPDTFGNQVAQILPAPSTPGHVARPFATAGMLDLSEAPSPGPLVTFQRPPATASAMVNNHTEMAFAPFADQVGTGLISHAAITHRVNAAASAIPLPPNANDGVPTATGEAPGGVASGATATANADAPDAPAPANNAPAIAAGNAAPREAPNSASAPSRNSDLGGANPNALTPAVSPATRATGQTP